MFQLVLSARLKLLKPIYAIIISVNFNFLRMKKHIQFSKNKLIKQTVVLLTSVLVCGIAPISFAQTTPIVNSISSVSSSETQATASSTEKNNKPKSIKKKENPVAIKHSSNNLKPEKPHAGLLVIENGKSNKITKEDLAQLVDDETLKQNKGGDKQSNYQLEDAKNKAANTNTKVKELKQTKETIIYTNTPEQDKTQAILQQLQKIQQDLDLIKKTFKINTK